MIHPRKVMISLRPPSASIFLIEAGSGCLIGSNAPDKCLKMTNREITTACTALGTILQFVGESSTEVAPSSIYPSAPPLRFGSILTSASSAAPNVTSYSCLRGLGSCWVYGEGNTSGPQYSQ